jgi:hypothetical protein
MKEEKEEEEESEYQEYCFQVVMTKREELVEFSDDTCQDCEKQYEVREKRAVALIGDHFYHDSFMPAVELEKAHKLWEGTLHDINHQGTTDVKGFTAMSNILFFVGYNDNVTYDKKTKSMSMDIHIADNTHYASAWKGYVELCELAGQTPNVSVSFTAKAKYVKASDLPEGVNYAAYGLDDDDEVRYLYDIKPQALSTVFRGACDDKLGCGIGKNHSKKVETHDEETEIEKTVKSDEPQKTNEEENIRREEIIKWLKANNKEEK